MQLRVVLVVLALSALVLPGVASAISIDGATTAGTVFALDFDGNVNGTSIAGLSAHADLEFVSFVDSQLILDITLENTSSFDSRISVLAFGSDPDIVKGETSGGYTTLITNSSFPNGVGAVEICAKNAPNGNNCLSGKGGPESGDAIDFRLVLQFADGTSAVDLTDFHVRYQSIVGVRDGDSGTGNVTDRPPVPEPGAALLFALGGLALSVAGRERG